MGHRSFHQKNAPPDSSWPALFMRVYKQFYKLTSVLAQQYINQSPPYVQERPNPLYWVEGQQADPYYAVPGSRILLILFTILSSKNQDSQFTITNCTPCCLLRPHSIGREFCHPACVGRDRTAAMSYSRGVCSPENV